MKSNFQQHFFQAIPSSFIATRSDFIAYTDRTNITERHTVYMCVVLIHGVFGAIHEGAQYSCRRSTDILALTGDEGDGEVDHHTARGDASDFNSHLA